MENDSKKIRHILNISGGKDSSALAIYMRDRAKWRERLGKYVNTPFEDAKMEYVFCDTGEELTETYEYLDKLEAYLGEKIIRLKDDYGFRHWMEVYGNFLPSPQMRWCTVQLKIKPFERYVGDDLIYSYVGIRADEDREGYISKKPNIKAFFPFKEDGIDREDVMRILEESGAGLPEYYKWRTRSGCYFCFFQRKAEWIGLLENHPKLFEKAKAFEKLGSDNITKFTWTEGESLEKLEKDSERIAQIKANHEKVKDKKKKERPNRPLNETMNLSGSFNIDLRLDLENAEILSEVLDEENDDMACNICHI